MFLNTGSARERIKGMPEEQLKQMQADHVGNFGKLFDQGRLLPRILLRTAKVPST